MASLASSLGFDPASDLSVLLFCAILTFGVVTTLWVVGLLQGNHSMMDGWYGFAYAVPALFAILIADAQSVTAALLLFMVMLHGGRLGRYLTARWRRIRSWPPLASGAALADRPIPPQLLAT
jgi:steroid 5-alpha reductase family enzyme